MTKTVIVSAARTAIGSFNVHLPLSVPLIWGKLLLTKL